MSDILENWRRAVFEARKTPSDDNRGAADRLAIQLSKRGVGTLGEIQEVVDTAIVRYGGTPGQQPDVGDTSEVWIEHLLLMIRESLKKMRLHQSSAAE